MLKQIYMLVNDPGTVGGIQRVISALSSGFRTQGYEVTVLGVRRPLDGRILLPEPGVTYVFPFPTAWMPASLIRFISKFGMKFERALLPAQWVFKRRLTRIVRENPGHIIAMDVFVAELSARVAVPTGATKVVQFHNSFDALYGTRDFDRLMRIVGHYDYLLALTEGDATSFAGSTSTRVLAMANPLPFTPAQRARSNADLTAKSVVSVGRLEPHKGFGLLIDSWGAIQPSSREGWTLRIIGEGEQYDTLANQIISLGLSDTVTLAGRSNNVQFDLQNADFLVLASEYEGLPMVLLEAMSQSVACIATESSVGVAALLGEERGLLVPVGDRPALTQALDELIQHPERRSAYAKAGYEKSKEFELGVTVDRWLTLLRGAGSTQ